MDMPGVALSTELRCFILGQMPQEAMYVRAEQVWGHEASALSI